MEKLIVLNGKKIVKAELFNFGFRQCWSQYDSGLILEISYVDTDGIVRTIGVGDGDLEYGGVYIFSDEELKKLKDDIFPSDSTEEDTEETSNSL